MDSANGGLQLVPLHHLGVVAYSNCFSPSLKLVRGFAEVCSFAQNDKLGRLLQLKLSFVQYIEILLLWEFFSFAFDEASRSLKTLEPFDDAYLLEHCLVNELWAGKLLEEMIRQFILSLDVENTEDSIKASLAFRPSLFWHNRAKPERLNSRLDFLHLIVLVVQLYVKLALLNLLKGFLFLSIGIALDLALVLLPLL